MAEAINVKIRRLRLSARMTRVDLATAAGISEAHLCRIETGKRGMSDETLIKMADVLAGALNLDASDLAGELARCPRATVAA